MDISINDISIYLLRWLLFIQAFSIGMGFVVLVEWRRRVAKKGFKFRDGIKTSEWNLVDLGWLILVLAVAYFGVILMGQVLLRENLVKNDNQKVFYILLFQGAFYVLFFVVTHAHLAKRMKSWNETFGLRRVRLSKLLMVSGVSLAAVLFPIELIQAITASVLNAFGIEMEPQEIMKIFLTLKDPYLKGGMVLLAVVGAPLVEETLFRGIIYPSLKTHLGFFPAVCITSTFFGLVHDIQHFPPLFFLAVALVLVYEWTESLLACIFVHAGFNGLSLFLALTLQKS